MIIRHILSRLEAIVEELGDISRRDELFKELDTVTFETVLCQLDDVKVSAEAIQEKLKREREF